MTSKRIMSWITPQIATEIRTIFRIGGIVTGSLFVYRAAQNLQNPKGLGKTAALVGGALGLFQIGVDMALMMDKNWDTPKVRKDFRIAGIVFSVAGLVIVGIDKESGPFNVPLIGLLISQALVEILLLSGVVPELN